MTKWFRKIVDATLGVKISETITFGDRRLLSTPLGTVHALNARRLTYRARFPRLKEFHDGFQVIQYPGNAKEQELKSVAENGNWVPGQSVRSGELFLGWTIALWERREEPVL